MMSEEPRRLLDVAQEELRAVEDATARGPAGGQRPTGPRRRIDVVPSVSLGRATIAEPRRRPAVRRGPIAPKGE